MNSIWSLLRRNSRRKSTPITRKPARRPWMEALEDRCVPAVAYFQGFETNTSGWDAFGGTFDATRVPSGTNGITSLSGSFHGITSSPNNGAATNWGGYTTAFPTGGYHTITYVYLNMTGGAANDTRFDFDSAINDAGGGFRRDFVFNGGFYNDSDFTGSGNRFVFSASNNATRSSSFPKNPGRDPFAVTTSGWYGFEHTFRDGGGGQLYVDLKLRSASGTVLHSWTLTNPTDIIGSTVGGNRYGWFVNQEFPSLAFDNSAEFAGVTPATTYVDASWASLPYGTDPDGAGPATAIGYDAFATIQSGVNAVATSGTVNVNAGNYVENVSINKSLSLLSTSGRGSTTITGISGVGALGTVLLTPGTNNVQIGANGQGFKIVGIDNGNPGIENAALYLQGSHNNVQILYNEIQANGDDGLLAEYGATNTNFTIDNNIFSGQTFVGPNPADNGFANQFTTPNVPRQLVVIGSGASGAGSPSNIIFTNNLINGTAGGSNGGGEQGNTLVTIDVDNSTITGNTFAGTTTRFGSALRSRRPNTTISGNTFNTSGMSPTTNSLFIQNNATPIQTIIASNSPDRGALILGGDTVWQTIQAAIANAPATGATVQVLPSSYAENVIVNNGLSTLTSISIQAAGAVTVNPASGNAFTVPNGVTANFIGTFTTTQPTVVNSGGTLKGNGTITGAVTINSSGKHTPGTSPGITNTGAYTENGVLEIEAQNAVSPIAGTDYDQVNVTGSVTLGGSSVLNVVALNALSYANGTVLTIINNDSNDPVIGTFGSLQVGGVPTLGSVPNGATFTFGGKSFAIFYNGGDGNDVVLVAVPSASAPAIVYVDDNWTSATPGTDPDGAGPATIFGYDAFATIQAGVNAVATNGTVHVYAGTYNEGVSVNKTVTLLGAQAGVDARTRAGAESVVNFTGGAFGLSANNIVIDGFTLQGQSNDNASPGFGYAIYMAPGTTGTQILNDIVQNNHAGVAVSNTGANQVKIQYSLFQDNTSGLATDIYADEYTAGVGGLSNVLIDSNKFTNTSTVVASWALGISNTNATPFTGLTFTGNEISNHGRGLYLYNTDNATISNNSITGVTNYAIGLFDGNDNISITNNRLQSGNRGVWLGADFGNQNTNVSINLNAIVASGTASIELDNGSYTGVLDASANYFGSSVPATVQATFANNDVDTTIDFTPLLDNDETVPNQAVVGFQPNLSSVTVHSVGTQTAPVARIQEGFNLVDAGGTVNVLAGTYVENVTLGAKVITLVTNGTSAAGVVNVTGNVSFGSGTTFQVDILTDAGTPVAGTDYDQWNVSGAFSAGTAILDIVSAVTPPINLTKVYTIVGGAGAKSPAFRNDNAHGNATLNGPTAFFQQDSDDWYLNYNNGGNITLQGAFNNPPVPTTITPAPFAEDDLAFTILLDATDAETPTNSLVFTVTSLPESGTLLFGGVPVVPGQTFTGPPANRTLVFLPGGNLQVFPSLTPVADSFTYSVTDTGGILNVNPLTVASIVNLTVNPSARADGLAPALATDPLINANPNNVLYITGTAGNDYITVTVSGLNFVIARTGYPNTLIPTAGIAQIRIFSRGGIDNVNTSTLTGVSVLIVGGDGNDNLYGGAGADFIYGGAGNDYISGNAGADFLSGGIGADTVYGGAGNDIITGGADVDYVYGDADDDIFIVKGAEATGDRITGGTGANTIVNGTPVPVSPAAPFAPMVLSLFSPTSQVQTIQGNGQPIFGTAGVDNLNFSSTLFVNVPYVDGRDGNDTITGTAGADIIYGGAGNDTIRGGSGNDTLYAYASDDVNAVGSDILYGGDDNDTLYGGLGNDTLYGEAGNDTLYGWAGNDYLSGGAGNDILFADTGADTLYGGDGDDLLNGGPGGESDWYYGENGDDLIQLQGNVTLARINGGANTVGGTDNIELLSDVVFSSFNPGTLVEGIITHGSTILGTSGNNVLDFSAFTTVTTDGVTPGILRVDGLGGYDTITGTKLPTRIVGAADYFLFDPATATAGSETSITNFVQGYSKLDVSAYGALTLAPVAASFPGSPVSGVIYRIQSGFDTLLLLNGKRIRIKNFTATTLAISDFVGTVS